jgi:predicted RNA-binding Zn-ribbon protein involved in translation (DUF1610 family)
MAEKIYSSIIDNFLDDREPDWEEVGLKDAQKSGEEQQDRTGKYIDKDFLDELAEEASRHTVLPPNSRSATLLNRLEEKESAAPRLGAFQRPSTRMAGTHAEDYKSDMGDDESLVDEVTMTIEQAEKKAPESKQHGVENRNVSDEEALAYVKKLLNQGEQPSKIAAKLEKLAEIELLDKQKNMGFNYLKNNEGLLGTAYIEPNQFMDKQSPAYEHTAAEKKKLRCGYCNKDVTPQMRDAVALCPECRKPLPVRPKTGATEKTALGGRICPSCKKAIQPVHVDVCPHCGVPVSKEPMRDWAPMQASSADCVRQHDAWKAAGIQVRAASVKKVPACEGCAFFKNKNCNLYHLPVVADAKELGAVINKLTAGVPAGSKRAALIALAERRPQMVEVKTLNRPAIRGTARTIESVRANHEAKPASFTPTLVEALHKKGHNLDAIYKAGIRKVGSVEAGRVIKEFVASLKEKGTKIALSQIDCKLLKQKLGVGNAIVGALKCADCVYRQDMHCGLTGGTLLAFPGMGKMGKVASAPPTDAAKLMKEFDLTERPEVGDIDMAPPERLEIEMGSKPSAGNL